MTARTATCWVKTRRTLHCVWPGCRTRAAYQSTTCLLHHQDTRKGNA